MIEFEKNINKVLPYNREQYLLREKWYGVSFQLPGVFEGKKIEVDDYLLAYRDWFEGVIATFDNGAPWIISHDFIDEDWFPNNNANLASLRMLFKKNDIPNTFIGALILKKDDLFKITKDLIIYPFSVFNNKNLLYNNLDISHSKYQLVIKVSAHMCIDVLSTDIELLRKVVMESSSLDYFKIIEYQGTSLLK